MGEFFIDRDGFDVYVCPRCGRVERFEEHVGARVSAIHVVAACDAAPVPLAGSFERVVR
jgi:hypothetical protein